MKNILFILLSFGLAAEMEVDGGLTVTEGVTATSFAGNGGGLTGIGIKPERIYQFLVDEGWSNDIIVPDGKLWIITSASFGSEINITLNGVYRANISDDDGGNSNFIAFPSQTMTLYSPSNIVVSIYEYSISGSGTSQGMDYVEP